MNSEGFLHCESIAYARATFPGSRLFQPSSASRTFWIAVSRVNGGKGGRVVMFVVATASAISPPAISSRCSSLHPHFLRRLAPELADVISQAVFHIARLV